MTTEQKNEKPVSGFIQEKRRNFALQLSLMSVMFIYFLLQLLFVTDGLFLLIIIVPFYLLYIAYNLRFAFKTLINAAVNFTILHVSLVVVFLAAVFINAVGHGSALISVSIGTRSFIIISYIVTMVITSLLSLICTVFSLKKATENKK